MTNMKSKTYTNTLRSAIIATTILAQSAIMDRAEAVVTTSPVGGETEFATKYYVGAVDLNDGQGYQIGIQFQGVTETFKPTNSEICPPPTQITTSFGLVSPVLWGPISTTLAGLEPPTLADLEPDFPQFAVAASGAGCMMASPDPLGSFIGGTVAGWEGANLPGMLGSTCVTFVTGPNVTCPPPKKAE